MYKKYTTTLSRNELQVLEALITDHGNVVDFAMICEKMEGDNSRQEIKNFIYKLVKKGWLIRVKRGVFIISDISGRGNIELSQLTIAQIIDNNSYISFEASWQYYGMFDQYLKTIISIGLKRSYHKELSGWTFKYIKSKKDLFSEFKEHNIDGQLIKIATKEKALLDFLEYRRNVHDIDLVIEKLRNYKNDFSVDLLIQLSKKYSITTKRILGFILELEGLDFDALYNLVKDNKNYSFMTSRSNKFNSKWRLYVEEYFIKK